VRPCDGQVWLIQPVAQTTTHGFLAVSEDGIKMGGIEIAIDIQGALEVLSLYLYLYHARDFVKRLLHPNGWVRNLPHLDFKLTTLVHRSLHIVCLQYLSSLLYHYVSFALPPSISSPNLVPTLLWPPVVFDMLAHLFGNPCLFI